MRGLLYAILLSLPLLHTAVADTMSYDPTAPSDPGQYRRQNGSRNSGWILNSTLVGPERRIAIINGNPVREGDRVGEARVLQIRASEVRLQTPGYPITLRLLANSNRSAIKARVPQ